MKANFRKKGFSASDLLIVIAVIGILIALLLPALNTVRESARRTQCSANQRQLVIALLIHEERNRQLPTGSFLAGADDEPDSYPDTDITAKTPGNAAATHPFSWHTKILSSIEQRHIFESLNFTISPFNKAAEQRRQRSMVIAAFLCPSYHGPKTSVAGGAGVTNYKSYGATTKQALALPEAVMHSEGEGGALHPYGPTKLGKVSTQTIATCETIEEDYAAWIDGSTACLFAFDEQNAPATKLAKGPPAVVFYPAADVKKNLTITALNNWHPKTKRYASVWGKMQWGPSSEHPGVVVHSFLDAHTTAISEDIDPVVFKGMVTRTAKDNKPVAEWQEQQF